MAKAGKWESNDNDSNTSLKGNPSPPEMSEIDNLLKPNETDEDYDEDEDNETNNERMEDNHQTMGYS